MKNLRGQSQSCTQLILSYVQLCDILVKPYEFKVNFQKRHRTILGGFLSIFIFLFAIIYFVAIFIKNTKSSEIIYAGSESQIDQNYRLDNNNTKFFFEITFSATNEGYALQENLKKYLSFNIQSVHQLRTNKTRSKSSKILNYTKCDDDFVNQFNLNQDLFETQKKENFVCITSPFEIFGDYYSQEFKYLTLNILTCQNSTEQNIICESEDNIKKFMENELLRVFIDFFILESKIKRNLNLSNPADKQGANIFWRLNLGSAITEDIFLSPIQFDFKQYPLFTQFNKKESENVEIFKGIRVARRERRSENINNNRIGRLNLRLENNQEYYFVIEDKIMAKFLYSLSQVVGLIIAIADIIAYLYWFYNEHKLLETLINSVFYFNDQMNVSENFKDNEEEKQIQKVLFLNQQFSKMFNHKSKYPFSKYIFFEIIAFLRKYLRLKCFRLSQKVKIYKKTYYQQDKKKQ